MVAGRGGKGRLRGRRLSYGRRSWAAASLLVGLGAIAGLLRLPVATAVEFREVARLGDPDGDREDGYGFAVDLCGDVAIVSAPTRPFPGQPDMEGAVLTYHATAGGDFVPSADLLRVDPTANIAVADLFGRTLALSCVNGTASALAISDEQGRVWPFTRADGGDGVPRWQAGDPTDVCDEADDPPEPQGFGRGIAVHGGAFFVGYPRSNRGEVARYTINNGNQLPDLVFPTAAPSTSLYELGESVAVDSASAGPIPDIVVAGAPGGNEAAGTGVIWIQPFDAPLHVAASDGHPGDRFGQTATAANGFAAFGAPNATSGAGAVYVFFVDTAGGTATETQKLQIPSCSGQGTTVDLYGPVLAVGARETEAPGRPVVLVFDLDPTLGTWRFRGTVGAAAGLLAAQLHHVALYDHTLLVGAADSGASTGSALLLERLPSTAPSLAPSNGPAPLPSAAPSARFSWPSTNPSLVPSAAPSTAPSLAPSNGPAPLPSAAPSARSPWPSTNPFLVPSAAPSTAVEQPGPRLVGALMSDDLLNIVVTFADPVVAYPYAENLFGCTEILAGPQLRHEKCRWSTPSSLQLLLGGEASTLLPGDLLALRDDVPLACVTSCRIFARAAGPATVDAPEVPATPVPVLRYAAEVSLCGGFRGTVDASASFGSGGRPLSFAWRSQTFGGLPMDPIRGMDATNATVEFFVHDLAESADGTDPSLRLTVDIANFVGATSRVEDIDIRRLPTSQYTAEIRGPSRRALRLDQEASFVGIITAPCEALVAAEPVIREWRVEDAGGGILTDVAWSVAGDTLLLSPYSGRPSNESFTLILSAVSASGEIRAEARAVVDALPLPLVPRLFGCNTTASPFAASSTEANAVLLDDAIHVVDGTQSWDPNLGAASSPRARDAVTLRLVSATAEDGRPLVAGTLPSPGAPSLNASCAAAGSDLVDLVAQGGLVLAKSFVLDIRALRGCNVTLGLALERSGAPGNPVFTTCNVHVVSAPSPELRIATSFPGKASTADRIAIRGEVLSSSTPILASWRLGNGRLFGDASLEDVTTTPSSTVIPGTSAPATLPVNLVLAAGALVERQAYTFVLEAQYAPPNPQQPSFLLSMAEISFMVNGAPLPGTFNVSPLSGSYATLFSMRAMGWEDDDLPLAYEFRTVARPDATPVLLNPTETSSNMLEDRTIPMELTGAGGIQVLLAVVDALGAVAKSIQNVTMDGRVLAGSATEAAAALLRDLERQRVEAEPIDDVYTTLASAASLLTSGETAQENATYVAEVQLQGVQLLDEAVASHFITTELLETQIAALEAILEARHNRTLADASAKAAMVFDASVATSAVAVVQQILGNAENMSSLSIGGGAEASGSSESAVGRGSAASLLRSLSFVLDLSNATPHEAPSALDVQDAAQQLQRIRAASFLANEEPEMIHAARIVSIVSVRTLDEQQTYVLQADPAAASSGDLGALLELGGELVASVGVGPFEDFFLGVVGVDQGAWASAAASELTKGSGRVTETLVTGVHRMAITLESTKPKALAPVQRTDPIYDFAGRFNLTQALSEDLAALQAQQCSRIPVGGSSGCEHTLPCSAFDPATNTFQALEGCSAELLLPTPMAVYGSVRCQCLFAPVGDRRLRDRTNETGDPLDSSIEQHITTVSLHIGTLLQTSGKTFRHFRTISAPQLPVLLTAVVLLTFFLAYAYRAQRLDARDAELDRLERHDALEEAHRWAVRHAFPESLRRKLLLHETEARHEWRGCIAACAVPPEATMRISSMEDVSLLRRESWAELSGFVDEHALTAAEARVLRDALEGPDQDSGCTGKIGGSRGGDGFLGDSLGSDEAEGALDTTMLDRAAQELRRVPRLDVNFWYGLLLATPHRLLYHTEESVSQYFWSTIRARHDVFDALSLHAGDAPTRFVRVVHFATATCAALFVTALVYQVMYPDDDAFCNRLAPAGEAACEADASQLNAHETRCYFERRTWQCRPTEPDPSAIGVVVATGFALMLVVPIAVYLRWHVDAFLGAAPAQAMGLVAERKDRRQRILQSNEHKRAKEMLRAELKILRAHPRFLPWYFRCMWPGHLARRLLIAQVAATARHAARVETHLDAEHSFCPMRMADRLPDEDYANVAHEMLQRKLLVTKLAVRDSLPWLKRIVFRNHTAFSLSNEVPSRRVRSLAMGTMAIFDAFCITYLIAFGANSTFRQAVGWLVSFVMGEILGALVIMGLRITILNVLMPTLVRPDVSVARAVSSMPHYSAAGILARQRPDLVPGLSAVLDARFQHDDNEGDDLGDEHAKNATDPKHYAAAADQDDETDIDALVPWGKAVGDREDPGDADGGPAGCPPFERCSWNRELRLAPGPRRSPTTEALRDVGGAGRTMAGARVRAREAGHTAPEAGNRGLVGRSPSAKVLRTGSKRAIKHRLRRNGSLTLEGINGAYSASMSGSIRSFSALDGSFEVSASNYRSGSDDVARRRSFVTGSRRSASFDSLVLSPEASFGHGRASFDGDSQSSTTLSEPDLERRSGAFTTAEDGLSAREAASISVPRPRLSLPPGTIVGEGASFEPGSGPGSSSTTASGSTAAPEGRAAEVHILDASKTLRRRNPILKWTTRLLLLIFAFVLAWPEPIQEFLLEEGIPVGLTLMLLVGLDLDVDEGIEVLISFCVVAIAVGMCLFVVYLVSTVIVKNLHGFKRLLGAEDSAPPEKGLKRLKELEEYGRGRSHFPRWLVGRPDAWRSFRRMRPGSAVAVEVAALGSDAAA